MKEEDEFSGLKRSGRLEVIIVNYGYDLMNIPWAKAELLKLGFVQGKTPENVEKRDPGSMLFVRECTEEVPLDKGQFARIVSGMEYEQISWEYFSGDDATS